MEDGNSIGTDRWEEEKQLQEFYGLTEQEATVYVADKRIPRTEVSEYLGIERQTIKNILSSANKKIRKADTRMKISIVRPKTKTKGTQVSVDILARFFERVTGNIGDFGIHTIVFTNVEGGTGDADWMDMNVLNAVTIADAVTPADIEKRICALCEQYRIASNGQPKMGWGVLKRKLDQWYVEMDIF